MCKIKKEISMGFTEKKYSPGCHMCLIYSDEAERRKVISQFLEQGILSGEKVSYFADRMSTKEVADWLQSEGVNIPSENGHGEFTIQVASEIYCPTGKFIPNDMLENLKKFYSQALEEDCTGARVGGEMSWATRDIPGSDRLMEYEALVNIALTTHPVTAICQYDANLFDGSTIFDVLRVHPMMVVNGQIVENPYYMRPEEFLSIPAE